MECSNFKNTFFFILVFCELELVLSQTSQENSHGPYDAAQHVQGFVGHDLASQKTKDIKIKDILKIIQTINFGTLYPTLLNILDNADNNSCKQDLLYLTQSINLRDPRNNWALKMLDSYGKPQSSLLVGNTKWIGDFDECRNVYAPKVRFSGGFYGKYCSVQMSLLSFSVTVGVCIPETCGPLDLSYLILALKTKLKSLPSLGDIESALQSVSCKPNSRQLNNSAIATICVISIFAFLVLVGSSVTVVKYLMSIKIYKYEYSLSINVNGEVSKVKGDMEMQADKDSNDVLGITDGSHTKMSAFIEKLEQFVNCFCIFTNGSKLLNTDATEGQLLCLHGIRFLSMTWVILCHTYSAPFSKLKSVDILAPLDGVPFQAIANGFFSVDSFFLLSGFLMAYLYFQEAAKGKDKIPWVYFYVHRYLRLTPVYMMVIAFFTSLYVYFGSGPFWQDHDVDPVCQRNWWWNALYVNNFQASAEQCMSWSWYLANDMQFFAISPLFLITLWRWPKIGYSILGLFFCGTWIASFVISYHYNLVTLGYGDFSLVISDPTFFQRWGDSFDKLYTKPYGRIGPYLVGIILAYLLQKRKLSNQKVNVLTLCVGWALATALGLTCVYSLYHNTPGRVAASFYNSLVRTCYGACLGWVIFVCLSGRGGVVDKILSYKLFIPLSRLTYCAYLIHPIIVGGYFVSLKDTFFFSHRTIVTLFLGLIMLIYAFAFLVSLLFESPVMRLEKFVRSKF